MRINHVLAHNSHPITSLQGSGSCLSYLFFGWWWVKSNVFSVYRFEYSCWKATRFLNMDVISEDGHPLEFMWSVNMPLGVNKGGWCWAGSLSLWMILFCRGTDLKGTKVYGITGCQNDVRVTDSFLEKDRGTRFYFLFVEGCVRKPPWESATWAETPRKGKGLLERSQLEGLLGEGSSGRFKELK